MFSYKLFFINNGCNLHDIPPRTWILSRISSLTRGLANLYRIGNITGAAKAQTIELYVLY